MNPIRLLLTVTVLFLTSVTDAIAADSPSFRYDVLPILTRAGCNSGTCHGTPSGKNGFRLSLRGFDPEGDLATLTREADGRRINRLNAEQSLLLQKATATIPHQGGRRFNKDDAPWSVLHDWIAAGARDDAAARPKLTSIRISPESPIIDHPSTAQAFRVTARMDDGTTRDVTDRCRFSLADELSADLDPRGIVHKLQRGEVTVSAEYAGQLVSTTLLFREPVADFKWTSPSANNHIDELVFARLKHLQIEPAELSDDNTFVRRVFLDANGQLPSVDDVITFIEDKTPDKREKLIDDLLSRPEFADWWAMKWTDRLGCNNRFVGKWGAIKYHSWIRHHMAMNTPHDEFVRKIITAGGPNYSNPPAGFWRRLRIGGIGKMDPLLAAEEISQLFMGVRIQCARCHNHPGEKWTQDDYYGLAAFFPRVSFQSGPYFNGRYDQETTVYTVPTGEVQHPLSGSNVAPKFLGEPTQSVDPRADRRFPFAEWLTSPRNPFFARSSVNRIWHHLFGRGIVEPVDDFRTSNPPAHPELLEWLAEEFIASGFNRKHIIRLILRSRTYQLTFERKPTAQDSARYFSYQQARRLQAEPLLDAICQVCEVPEQFPGFPLGTRAVQLPDGEYKHPFMEAFGRPARALACECERETEPSLAQALQIGAGRTVQTKFTAVQSRITRLLASNSTNDQIIDELFLATLARKPTSEEFAQIATHLNLKDITRQVAFEDILWSLLNHVEFIFQH